MAVRFLTTRILPAAATLGVAVSVYSGAAQAFFPPIITVDQPGNTGEENPDPCPPVPPPPFPPPPPPHHCPPGPNDPCGCPDPHDVPEPGTLAIAAIGLGIAGATGARKVLKKKDEKKG